MNENNYIQTTTKSNILHDSIIENMYIKAYESITDAENSSKEKYITKATLIKSSNDMSTQEILTSLDKNYECRNGERRQNVLYFTIISFSVLAFMMYLSSKVNPKLNSLLMAKLPPDILAQTSSFFKVISVLSMPLATILFTSLSIWNFQFAWGAFLLLSIVVFVLSLFSNKSVTSD